MGLPISLTIDLHTTACLMQGGNQRVSMLHVWLPANSITSRTHKAPRSNNTRLHTAVAVQGNQCKLIVSSRSHSGTPQYRSYCMR